MRKGAPGPDVTEHSNNMDLEHYNSYVKVDLGAIQRNVERIKAHIGPGHGMIPVVKGNAYGLGTVAVARTLAERCGIGLIANAHVLESIQIREAGIDVDLMILGALPPHAIPYAPRYDIQLTVFNGETVRLLSAACRKEGKLGKVHIKLETGLGRIGVKPGPDLERLLDEIERAGNLEIVGAFTHYATATQQQSQYAKGQFALFQQGMEQLYARGIHPAYVHTASTGATVWFKDSYCTHVRCGILYMGYSNLDDRSNPLGVEEAATWRAFITNVKQVQPGESVGYNRHFIARQPTRVATIDVGYSAGLNQPLALQGGPVLVHGQKTRYLGICMDQSFIDVTGIDCKLFDEVTLLGWDDGRLLSLYDVADFAQQNPHSILSAITPVVLRVYGG